MKRACTIWFTSDLHFGHKSVKDFQPDRPGNTVSEHDEALIRNWNKNIGPADTVIVLGDVFFSGSTYARSIMNRLNGNKIRVRGNHDSWSHTQAIASGFSFSCDYLEMTIAGQKVILSHYPYRYTFWQEVKAFIKNPFRKKPRYSERRPRNEGEWLLHGHTHSYKILRNKMIHVGVDAWNYRPVHISHIENIIQTGKLPKNLPKQIRDRQR